MHADGRTGSRPTLNITVVDAGAGLCRKLLNTFGQTFGVCRQINDEPVKPQVLRGLGVGSVRIIGNENQTLGARRNVFKDELGREVFGFLRVFHGDFAAFGKSSAVDTHRCCSKISDIVIIARRLGRNAHAARFPVKEVPERFVRKLRG